MIPARWLIIDLLVHAVVMYDIFHFFTDPSQQWRSFSDTGFYADRFTYIPKYIRFSFHSNTSLAIVPVINIIFMNYRLDTTTVHLGVSLEEYRLIAQSSHIITILRHVKIRWKVADCVNVYVVIDMKIPFTCLVFWVIK